MPTSQAQQVVLGVDGWKIGWVGVVLDRDGRYVAAVTGADIDAIFTKAREFGNLRAAAIDMPIGLPATGVRQAEALARKMVGRRASSVFTTPTRSVLTAGATYQLAAAAQQAAGAPGLSRQTFALVPKIREVDDWHRAHHRELHVVEVHPEVCFAALAGGPLAFGKRSWNGFHRRRRLLLDVGIELPEDLGPPGTAGADDVLDAAVCAWTALCLTRGTAECCPDPPESLDGVPAAIWFARQPA